MPSRARRNESPLGLFDPTRTAILEEQYGIPRRYLNPS
jgi:predicted Ser/Thr protein kinase